MAIGSFDAAIVAAYLVGVTALGIWLGRGQHGIASYLLGGRNVPWAVVLLSIVATETSTVTFLSIPGLAFDPGGGNLLFLQLAMGFALGRVVIVLLFLPHYFRGEIFTAYEVLNQRFGGATKRAASLMFLVTRNLADGLRLYLTALVLQQMLRLPLPLCVALVGCTTMVYTFAGGMKSIVWNDCIQFAIYIVAATLAAGVILNQLPGGWNQYLEFAQQHGKFRLFDLSPDLSKEFTLWSGLVGGIFISLATHGTDQLMVQRYLAARSQREAGRALTLSGLVVFAQFALFLLIGVGLACFFHLHPPDQPLDKDQAFAAFIVGFLPPGIKGLTLAGVFAAAMSVLSGSLNSSAAAAVNDWYRPARKTPPTDRHLLWVSRCLTVIFGAILMAVALAGPFFAESVVKGVLRIASFASGLVLGVFFLGVLTRRTSQRDALVGLLGGLIVLTTVIVLTKICAAPLAWPWFALVGSMATLGIGWMTSWLGGEENRYQDR